MEKKFIYSWLEVFKKRALVTEVSNYEDLYARLNEGFRVSGNFHSYNKSALHKKVIQLRGEFETLQYNPYCKTIRVGAATKIKAIMEELVKHGRTLPNSGNFFEQTIGGAILGCTAGFGKSASIADAALQMEATFLIGGELFTYVTDDISLAKNESFRAVTHLVLKTIPTRSFKVTNCVCNLSDVKNDNTMKAYAVLPYSDPNDPVCLIANYEINTTGKVASSVRRKKARPWHWWRVKLWWKIDQFFPPLRRWIQRALNFLKLKPFVIYTDPNDWDALYDPAPGLSRKHADFTRWSYRPTFVAWNTALYVHPADTKDLIRYAVSESEKLKSTLLRCFIGVRPMTDKSSVAFTGNAEGPVDAVDFYCSPKDSKYLIQLQKRIQKKFMTRPHHGKTVS